MDFRSVVELRDPTIGRMLARNLTVSAVSDVYGIHMLAPQDTSGDELAARYLAALARKVPEGVLEDSDGYKTGSEIDWKELASLCPDALDSLVGSYLEKTRQGKHASVDRTKVAGLTETQTPRNDQSVTIQPAERQTKRLLRILDDCIDRRTNTVKNYMDPMGGLGARGEWNKAIGGLKGPGGLDFTGDIAKSLGALTGLGGLGISQELQSSFERTAQLARDVEGALANIRTPALASD